MTGLRTTDRRGWAALAMALSLITAMMAAIRFGPVDIVEEADARLPALAATDIHAELGYSLATVAKTKRAPRLFIGSLEADLARIKNVAEKKGVFFRIMLPIVAAENDRIRAERARIVDADDDAELKDLYAKYEVDVGERETLLRRVDIVPASLALAQAAIESGWGSSRFARQANNFFGMRTYKKDVPGIQPKEADGFKVTAFRDIRHSVRAYMKNLNTHDAYAKFRRERKRHRHADGRISGLGLTGFLTSYSEIPKTYGKHLRALINANRLQRFEGVRLEDG